MKGISKICILLCCVLVFAGCKSDGNRQQQGLQEIEQQLEGNINPSDTEPLQLLSAYTNRKFDTLGKMMELMDASTMANEETADYEAFINNAVFPVMDCGSELDKAILCLTMLNEKAANDWELFYGRYTGYMDLVDGLYKFEFYIAEEDEQAEETEAPQASPSDDIMNVDPLSTFKEETLPPTIIPDRLAGYIEGTLPEGSNRMAVNAYTGKLEDGSRALTLWFEFTRDPDGGYWAQYFYAWDDVGTQFTTVREHVYGDSITYGILRSEDRPGSIFSLQLDEETFFTDANRLMSYDGTKAHYEEDTDTGFAEWDF